MKTSNDIPRHIGIIIDGNRRWAKKRGLEPWKGHEAGFKRLHKLFEWCRDLGIREVTVYTFSVQNFKRPKEEIKHLFTILVDEAKKFLVNPDIRKYKVRIRAIGRLHLFPKYVRVAIAKVVEATKEHDRYFVNFALGYGGREEITDAVRALVADVEKGRLRPEEVGEKAIHDRLYLTSEPDLVIRTSGERRTSNFLPWQSTYSEWHFTRKLFPDFSKADLIAAIEDFQNRERRFGQ
jgi:tritrans,polycis-undecaprenyl-diphosphate synthase [geranylgeranyl-diphosphate specific]